MIMMKRMAPALALLLGLWGCSSPPAMKRAMPLEGATQLPPPKSQQVATYRCSINLETGEVEVKPGKRTGPEEEAAWKSLSAKLQNGSTSYEVIIEENERTAKGTMDWAMVTVVEKQSAGGKVLRTIPVQEFWGIHDRHTPRALMMKDGRFQFFVQFWPVE